MKKKTKKLALAKETVRNLGVAVSGGSATATDACTYTCGNSCGSVCPGSRMIACFNTQQATCTR